MRTVQGTEYDGLSPAAVWDRDMARRALDDLFSHARHYRSSKAYWELIRFVSRFHFYSPFNAMLVHVQMPGATFVAPAHRWLRDYRRRIKPAARPLVILQPMGPVMFVFDVSGTEPVDGASSLPREVEQPFEVRHGHVGRELPLTIENAKRDGVRVDERKAGSQSAGQIGVAKPGKHFDILVKMKPEPVYVQVPVQYEILVNSDHSRQAQYATLVHELAHLYCGHLGTPNEKWWPDRRGLSEAAEEFEAESVTYLVCARLGIANPSASYLAGYLTANSEVPPISLDCVMKVAGQIEKMGRERLSPRKEKT